MAIKVIEFLPLREKRLGMASEETTIRFLKSLPQLIVDMLSYAYAHDKLCDYEIFLRQAANNTSIYALGAFMRYFPEPADVGEPHDIYVRYNHIIFTETNRRWNISVSQSTISTMLRLRIFLLLNARSRMPGNCPITYPLSPSVLDELMQDIEKGHDESFKKYLDEIDDIVYLWALRHNMLHVKDPDIRTPAQKTNKEYVDELIDICQKNNKQEALMVILRLTKNDEKPTATYRL